MFTVIFKRMIAKVLSIYLSKRFSFPTFPINLKSLKYYVYRNYKF